MIERRPSDKQDLTRWGISALLRERNMKWQADLNYCAYVYIVIKAVHMGVFTTAVQL
jgi:hypothetical protein